MHLLGFKYRGGLIECLRIVLNRSQSAVAFCDIYMASGYGCSMKTSMTVFLNNSEVLIFLQNISLDDRVILQT